jgi:peptidoglycan/xylan/chitin deacetylase (PgdA/CDA1 family)
MQSSFPSGAVILSIDTEHIWGYFDHLTEPAFHQRFPGAVEAQDRLLAHLREAGISATWFVVGAMALRECAGSGDARLAALSKHWTRRIPEGRESSAGLWYRPSFVRRLLDARPLQEIGLHGGLTHLVWTDSRVSQHTATHELQEGIRALEELGVRPRTFSFARTEEAYRSLLPANGLRSYRGLVPTLGWRLGRTWPGAFLRALDEWCVADPPVVWPRQVMPGLWNVPASMFFYPIRPLRSRVLPIRSRLERFNKGVEAAIRSGAIFHFSLHPENLAESPHGFAIFDEMLDRLNRACHQEGVEVLTMSDVISRMERNRLCSTTAVTPATT